MKIEFYKYYNNIVYILEKLPVEDGQLFDFKLELALLLDACSRNEINDTSAIKELYKIIHKVRKVYKYKNTLSVLYRLLKNMLLKEAKYGIIKYKTNRTIVVKDFIKTA